MSGKNSIITRRRVWSHAALIIFTWFLTLFTLNNWLEMHTVQAEPPAFDINTGQLDRVKSVLQDLGYSGNEPYTDWRPEACPDVSGLQTRVDIPGGIPPEQMSPGQESTHLSVFLFPIESQDCVPLHFTSEYKKMASLFTEAMGAPWLPERFTINGNLDAAVQAFTWQLRELSDGMKYPYGYSDGIFACGTVFFHVYGAQMGAQAMNEWDDWNEPAQQLAENQVPRTKAEMEKLASALLAANACGIESEQVIIPTETFIPFEIKHGCSYDELSVEPRQIHCTAAISNSQLNANIKYTWKLDGTLLVESGNTLIRDDKDIASGTHTIFVTAKDTRNNKEASSSFTFTKPGGTMSISVQCKLHSKDVHTAICVADVKNIPVKVDLVYEWNWDGALQDEIGSTLNKIESKDGIHTVTVRVFDQLSEKSTDLASTTIQVGESASSEDKPPAECVTGPNNDPYVEIITMDGDVSARTGMGNWTECSTTQKLGSDVELHTGPESTVTLKFPDGAILEVKPLTQLMIGTLLDKANRFKITLLLELGAVKANVQHRETVRSDFSIRTPTATASVKGTVFTVSYDENTGVTSVNVENGEVRITPTTFLLFPVMVSEGQQVEVTKFSVSNPVSITSDSSGTVSWNNVLLPIIFGCVCLTLLLGLIICGVLIIRRSQARRR